MKKGLSLFILLFSSSLTLFAQLRHEQQSQIGIRVAANFSTINDGINLYDEIKEPLLSGINAGLAASFWMNDFMAFAPEVNFGQRGFKIIVGNDAASPFEDFTYTTRYNYIEVPLLLRATVGHQMIRGFVNLGPSISYLISGKLIKFDKTHQKIASS